MVDLLDQLELGMIPIVERATLDCEALMSVKKPKRHRFSRYPVLSVVSPYIGKRLINRNENARVKRKLEIVAGELPSILDLTMKEVISKESHDGRFRASIVFTDESEEVIEEHQQECTRILGVGKDILFGSVVVAIANNTEIMQPTLDTINEEIANGLSTISFGPPDPSVVERRVFN